MVVSDIEPHLEATLNGKYARVFATKNVDDLGKRLCSLLSDTAAREGFADESLEYTRTILT